MASEIRVNQIQSRTGVSTISFTDTGPVISGVTTVQGTLTVDGGVTANDYGNITATTATFSGNVSIGGTLTYDDVTNIDSIGVVTARSGINIGVSGSGDNTFIDNLTNGHLNIINSGRQANNGRVRINKTNSASGDTTYFRDFEVYDGKDKLLFLIDGSEDRIGVGTDGPAGKLHLSSGESGDCVLIIESDTDNNEETDNPYIEFRQDGGLAHSKVGLEDNELVIANSVISGEGIVFKVGQSSTPGWQQATERVSIGTSETVCTGFYRATNIPFMRAVGSPSVPTGSGAETVRNFSSVEQNNNFNSYNNSTGIYKVPVNGLYWASCAITCTHTPSNTTSTLISLTHSGPGLTGPSAFGANYRESHITMSAAGVFNCLAGDEIRVVLSNGASIFASTPRNYFTVALLG